jgi:purine-binding chemotaxis protein CheW
LVGFEVGGVTYALDIARVHEILRPTALLSLPELPPSVAGVVDHRGDVVPIVDLRRRFGVEASGRERDQRWVIVGRGELRVALAVDRVTEVFGVGEAAARELPDLGPGASTRGIKAAYAHAGRLVFVLDADALTDVAGAVAWPSAAELYEEIARGG